MRTTEGLQNGGFGIFLGSEKGSVLDPRRRKAENTVRLVYSFNTVEKAVQRATVSPNQLV